MSFFGTALFYVGVFVMLLFSSLGVLSHMETIKSIFVRLGMKTCRAILTVCGIIIFISLASFYFRNIIYVFAPIFAGIGIMMVVRIALSKCYNWLIC